MKNYLLNLLHPLVGRALLYICSHPCWNPFSLQFQVVLAEKVALLIWNLQGFPATTIQIIQYKLRFPTLNTIFGTISLAWIDRLCLPLFRFSSKYPRWNRPSLCQAPTFGGRLAGGWLFRPFITKGWHGSGMLRSYQSVKWLRCAVLDHCKESNQNATRNFKSLYLAFLEGWQCNLSFLCSH